MLSIVQAKKLINELKEKEISLGRQPETWFTYENHVMGVANVAKIIAQKIPEMNTEKIFVAAMLHDICKTEELRKQRFHGILGYEKLINFDEKSARSALLHMFPWNFLPDYQDCSKMFFNRKDDYDFIKNYINSHETTDEDLLIQLADSLANKDGIVTLEQRAKEYSERHNMEIPKEMIEPRYKLKSYFDTKVGCDVYILLKNQHNNPINTHNDGYFL